MAAEPQIPAPIDEQVVPDAFEAPAPVEEAFDDRLDQWVFGEIN